MTPKPLDNGQSSGADSKISTAVPPVLNCPGNGCDSISLKSGGADTNKLALNALDSSPFTVEPPDQGLCAGNGFVMELVNLGAVRVYGSDLQPVSGTVQLDDLFGLTARQWSGGGDVMCTYDVSNGGHWFIVDFVSTTPDSIGGPFAGCFIGVPNTCLEGIAVSSTNDPTGAYNVYFFDPNAVNTDPGQSTGQLLNDYVKIATTRDAFLMFYDEFNLGNLPACPAFGCAGFNGAQQLAFNKKALELGLSTSNPLFTYAYENMGTASNLYPIPANGVFQPATDACSGGFICWYQVIPAQSSGPSQWNNNNGGTGFMVGSLDFLGAGDNRLAVFDWTGLKNLNSPNCSACSHIGFGGQLLNGLQTYRDEGGACLASSGGFCGLAPQKAGLIPLGDNCDLIDQTPFPPLTGPCPVQGIASNGDGAEQAWYGGGQVWTAINTLVVQKFDGSSETHLGAAFWGVQTGSSEESGKFSVANQGYVSASHEDIVFPSVAADNQGNAIMAFTLSGNGGPTKADNGGFFPSSAYVRLSADPTIHVTALGKAPNDGIGQYFGLNLGPPFFRPRWGDYSQTVFDSSTGTFLFATEYIQSPNCADWFPSNLTCDGTRAVTENWGTSISTLET